MFYIVYYLSAPEVPSYVPNWNDSREDEKGTYSHLVN